MTNGHAEVCVNGPETSEKRTGQLQFFMAVTNFKAFEVVSSSTELENGGS